MQKKTIAKEVKEEILAKVKAGEPVSSLSKQYGVSDKAIYNWLRGGVTHQVSWMEHIRLKKENQQLKEIIGVLTFELEKSKKRQLIEAVQAKVVGLSKSLLSALFGFSRKGIYLQPDKIKSKDELLRQQTLQVLEVNPSYGHRRIAIALRIGKKRVGRVMKLYCIKPYKRKARWGKKRDYGQPDAGYPNLIKGSCPIKPKVVYVGDFTRLSWNAKIIYLATFMDLYTREIVGWTVSTKHTKEFVMEAFLEAVVNSGKPQIVHTDQGAEYRSKEYIQLMNSLNVQISMSAKGSPWENGYQESFYNNFKTDLGLEFERFQTIGELVEAIHQVISYYNNQRIHTTLKMPPTQFRQQIV